MKKEELQHLAEKISNGTATEEEVALFNACYNQFQSGEQEWDTEALGDAAETAADLHARIRAQLERPVDGRPLIPLYLKVAASVILLCIAGWIFLLKGRSGEEARLARQPEKQFKNDVAPGKNKALLTLADGTTIVLDDRGNGELAQQGNTAISKTGDGTLVYREGDKRKTDRDASAALLNTVATPRGGQYQLTLPDGTRVWLNAASSLRFPAVFNNEERVVELEGEAYFEVAKRVKTGNTTLKQGRGERLPFIVKTGGQVVEVLGTHFNINAYRDESWTRTTLLEGSVRVTANTASPAPAAFAASGMSKVLVPGQQSRISSSPAANESNKRAILIDDVDTDEAVAWKNGMFEFNNSDIRSIMRQLERWYGVEADMEGMPEKRFNGIIPRDVKLSQVLLMMEKTSGIKFRIEGRRISMVK